MKKMLFVLGILFISLSGHTQDQVFKDDVKKLVKMTLDIGKIDMTEDAITYDLKGEAKEKMLKDYKAVVTAFFNEFETYYISKYTHEEIKEIIKFYESPAGKRALTDKNHLLDNEFPNEKVWNEKLQELSKKYKELKKS